MANRPVTQTGKNSDGDITQLCNPGQAWSPRSKQAAIKDIDKDRIHQYHVPWPDGQSTQIRVVDGPTGKYLRTDKDDTERNNLDDLPDC